MTSEELVRLSDLAEPPRAGFLKWWFYSTFMGRDLDCERDVRRMERIFAFGKMQRDALWVRFREQIPDIQHADRVGSFYDVT